ncbi:MAG TPA: hypothetical protein VFA60_01520 [Terriglobales bacterium]|nr:hypothetical protein [Terriglobales bacterium]
MSTTAVQAPERGFWLRYLSLFSSLGTLLCCALPSLLILFGLGATVASVLSAAPWLVSLSQHKGTVFGAAGALIAGNFIYVYAIVPRLPAPACEPGGNTGTCATASRATRVILWTSAALYSVGALVAFVLGPFLVWVDNAQ